MSASLAVSLFSWLVHVLILGAVARLSFMLGASHSPGRPASDLMKPDAEPLAAADKANAEGEVSMERT